MFPALAAHHRVRRQRYSGIALPLHGFEQLPDWWPGSSFSCPGGLVSSFATQDRHGAAYETRAGNWGKRPDIWLNVGFDGGEPTAVIRRPDEFTKLLSGANLVGGVTYPRNIERPVHTTTERHAYGDPGALSNASTT